MPEAIAKEWLRSGKEMELNLGPQHPSTHGVLRIRLKLDGEVVTEAEPIIGYLHTGVEKECESRTYTQIFTLVDRLDYLAGPFEEQAFAQAVEKFLGIHVPERAEAIRVLLLELDGLLTENAVWCERLQGVAIVDEELCKQYACTGPVLRGCGVAYDLRKESACLGYNKYQFNVPTKKEGDAYAR